MNIASVSRIPRRILALTLILTLFTVQLIIAAAPAQAAASISSSEEQDFVTAINALRAENGVGALTVVASIQDAARDHTWDMEAAGQIFHATDITTGAPAGWQKVGENVGVGPNVSILMNAFINSPGHFANLVDPSFTHVGVGVVRDGATMYTTHRFAKLTTAPAPSTTPESSTPPDNLGFVKRYAEARLDLLEAGPGLIRIQGWSYDPDKPDHSTVIHVYAFFDGSSEPVALDTPVAAANKPRPDVNQAFDISGDHGFFRELAIRPGTHKVCVYSISVDEAGVTDGANRLIRCETVTITDTSFPRGSMDVASRSGNNVTARGWAYDLDSETSPIDIEVTVDGVLNKTIPADNARPDINKILFVDGDHGFDETISVTTGSHQVCFYTVDVNPDGSNGSDKQLLGCHNV